MKKILVALLCGAMLLSMTACGQNEAKETKETAAGTESTETAGETAAAGDDELKYYFVIKREEHQRTGGFGRKDHWIFGNRVERSYDPHHDGDRRSSCGFSDISGCGL